MQNPKAKKPILKDAFVLGKHCFLKLKVNNPYKRTSHLYKEWQRGFNTAYFENLERIVQQ